MAVLFVDRTIFLPSSGGTGSFVVALAATGYLTPAQSGALDGSSYRYAAELRSPMGVITDWEVGTGVYTAAGTTLTRSVEFSSNSNALVSFAAPPTVMLTALAADFDPLVTAPLTSASPGTPYSFAFDSQGNLYRCYLPNVWAKYMNTAPFGLTGGRYVAEDGVSRYVAENGTDFYVTEF